MSAGDRITAYLEALATRLKTPGPFVDVRNHLDLFDLEDALKESFRTPAARVIFAGGKPLPGADGGVDLEARIVVAVITKREGRPAPLFASADIAALTLGANLISLVNADPYFGQPKVTALTPAGFKVAVSEKASKDGIAISLVELAVTFLRIAEGYDPVKTMFAAGAPAGGIVVTVGGDTIAGGTP